jgi:glycosyltransferase involved in cell wall biosynthesis
MILILLPTYNGARYLAEQLDSLLSQTHTDWRALVRDDGSSDDTLTVLQRYVQAHPDRFELVQDGLGNLGVKRNVSALLGRALQRMAQPSLSSQRCWIALADQDDVWLPHKLSHQLLAMQRLEEAHPTAPCLVHSDLRVVNEQLLTMADSMAAFNGLRMHAIGLGPQLVSNTLTGCTALMNPALVQLALPIPDEAIMHDWWLSLVASAFGQRHYMAEPLVLYRQHSANTVGAKALNATRTFVWQAGWRAWHANVWGLWQAAVRFVKRLNNQDHARIFQANAQQARQQHLLMDKLYSLLFF